MWIATLILTVIGIVCGVLIWVTNKTLPPEPESLKKAEELNSSLPGMNCGACGYPGCFAYAQAIAKDKNVFLTNSCTTVLQNEKNLTEIEKALGFSLGKSNVAKKAVVQCGGESEHLGYYYGANTCRSAANVMSGFKVCPYSCMGLGDCVNVCPVDAISIDKDKHISVVDVDKCTGCGLCVKECPRHLIKLFPDNSKVMFLCSYDSVKDIPGREKCGNGCIHCKKCFKACEYGAIEWDKEKMIPVFLHEKCTECGKCIEACPNDVLKYLKKDKKA